MKTVINMIMSGVVKNRSELLGSAIYREHQHYKLRKTEIPIVVAITLPTTGNFCGLMIHSRIMTNIDQMYE